jgi:hypothetical protein
MTCTHRTVSLRRHTPAPWEYHPEEDGQPITDGKIALACLDAYVPEEGDGGAWEKEKEANGRLMAAAPDLLEAVKDCIRQIHALLPAHQQSDSTLDNLPAVLKARAAIARAVMRAA